MVQQGCGPFPELCGMAGRLWVHRSAKPSVSGKLFFSALSQRKRYPG